MRRRFAAILIGPGCAVGCVGHGVRSHRRDVAGRSVCHRTGIGAVRALILWPEMVTLGGRCSRWPSWQWPLIIDGPIVLATLGFSRWRPTRPAAESGVLLGSGDGRPSQCGRQLAARLTCRRSLWRRGCGPVAKRGGKAVSHRVPHAISRQAVRRGGVRPWGAAEPAAVDRRITVSWLTSVLGEGFAPRRAW
jgi:hypothetical protein